MQKTPILEQSFSKATKHAKIDYDERGRVNYLYILSVCLNESKWRELGHAHYRQLRQTDIYLSD